jgi:hypothetical protein
MTLNQILQEHGIYLYDDIGDLRSSIDIIEDMYLLLNSDEFKIIMNKIMNQEHFSNIFEQERKDSE